MAQAKGDGDHNQPTKTGVKQESDAGFTTGTDRIVGLVGVCHEGHLPGADQDHNGGKMPYGFGGVIKQRENAGYRRQNTAENETENYGKKAGFPEGIFQFFGRASCALHLPQNYADYTA